MEQQIDTAALEQVGLSKDHALMYRTLLKRGFSKAQHLAKDTGLTRTYAYKILDDLVEMKLAERREDIGKIALFFPAHPATLRTLIEKKQENIKAAETGLQSILGTLVSDFNLLSGKPNMQFYEGAEGLSRLYKDILAEEKNILLIRSPLDETKPEIAELVEKQIKAQIKADIHVRAITPLSQEKMGKTFSYDKENLVTRREVLQNEFMIPAQMIIYGNKVGITSFGEKMVTTIIENNEISVLCTVLFEFIWKRCVEVSEKTSEKPDNYENEPKQT